MTQTLAQGGDVSNYFVDEAGDATLFGRGGRLLVGAPGCSKCFMIGVAHLPDPAKAAEELGCLRKELLADPYFRDVPSMQPDGGKTALGFHACKDLPEVRREVLRLLPCLQAKVQVVIRRKLELAEVVRRVNAIGRTLSGNDLYDDLVKRLFRNLLHKADQNSIVFAWRGKGDRAEALTEAVARAKRNFDRRFGSTVGKPTRIHSARPRDCAGLQVFDYYLWALQRLHERGEDRFFSLLAPGYRLIMDLDDTRNKPYGEWYSDANPLTLRKMKAL